MGSATESSPRSRLLDRLFEPVDAAGLVWIRFIFGAVMLWEVCRYLAYGWVGRHYIDPPFHFTYFGWDWVRPLPGDWMYLHMAVLGVLALFVALGLFYRVSAALFFVGFTWFFLIEQAKYLNHLYLVCLLSFLMIFLPAARCASLDILRRPERARDSIPAWALWAVRFEIGAVYFFGGIAKINGDWLQAEPMRTWMASKADYPVFGPLLALEPTAWFLSYAGLLFDLFIPFILLWRPTRWIGLAMVIFFHASNEYMFSIGIFPYLMSAASLVFFPPDWPRKAFPVVFRKPAADPSSVAPGLPRPAVYVLLVAWVGYNCFMPLRHWLYPGNPSWTEEGHLYAWHMKLRSKTGRARFHVLDKDTGEHFRVRPADYLTDRQLRKMKTRPDLAHQFALYLAQVYRDQGHANVAVHAEVLAGLNGRPLEPLIDPAVDLAATPRTLGHSAWILPLTEPLPTARWAWADRMARPRAPDRGTLPQPGSVTQPVEEPEDE